MFQSLKTVRDCPIYIDDFNNVFFNFIVISRIGTILVDGKVYPPAPPGGPTGSGTPPAVGHAPNPLQQMAQQIDNRTQAQPPRQRQSPNVTPPLRPLLPQAAANTGYSNNNPGMFSGVPNYPSGMRTFSNDSGRFPMPHAMGPPQPHVSSSTHPNMGSGKYQFKIF